MCQTSSLILLFKPTIPLLIFSLLILLIIERMLLKSPTIVADFSLMFYHFLLHVLFRSISI